MPDMYVENNFYMGSQAGVCVSFLDLGKGKAPGVAMQLQAPNLTMTTKAAELQMQATSPDEVI